MKTAAKPWKRILKILSNFFVLVFVLRDLFDFAV